MPEAYTLQEYTAYDVQISTDGELVVKSQYINCMQDNMKYYWEKSPQQQKYYCYNTHKCASMFEFNGSN